MFLTTELYVFIYVTINK